MSNPQGSAQNNGLITHLEQFISERRKARLREVLSQRTGHIRVVLEDVYQAHNASAVLRSCECFGIQHVHFIENRNRMQVNEEVSMGSAKWLSIHRHREQQKNTGTALQELKSLGYALVGVTPHQNEYLPETLPVEKKFALVFGTEMQGLSNEAMRHCDHFLKIPMVGFTESFNVSVCTALCLYALTTRLKAQGIPPLSNDEKEEIYLRWLKADVEMSEAIIERFLNDKK